MAQILRRELARGNRLIGVHSPNFSPLWIWKESDPIRILAVGRGRAELLRDVDQICAARRIAREADTSANDDVGACDFVTWHRLALIGGFGIPNRTLLIERAWEWVDLPAGASEPGFPRY